MKKLSKVAAELLATYVNLIDSEFNAHICENGEFDNESVQFSDSYRVFYDGKDNNTDNYITVYSFNSEKKSSCVLLNFSHEETEGIQELLEFAFNQCEFAEKSNETIWSNTETNWIVDLDVIIELIEDFKNPYGINNPDLGVKAEYEKNRASRSYPLDESYSTDLTDLEQIQDDWLYVLEKVEDFDPFIIIALKSIPIHYVEDLRSDNGLERVAEFVVEYGLEYSLNVGGVYFELKREVAIGALLHEIAHAILAFRYLLTGNTSAYNLYARTNGGHTEDWWKIATELTKYFNEKIEIVETLDLRDASIYEYPIQYENYNDDAVWSEEYSEPEEMDSNFSF